MRIAIFGSGGVGGYYGGRLAQSGQSVAFIARGEHRAAIAAHGLQVESPDGDFIINPANVFEDPAQIGPVDIVIVATKTWDIPAIARHMRPLLGKKTCVLPLENGVDSGERLAAVVGPDRVLGGLCRISSFILRPGVIRHVGGRASIMFGEMDNRPSERVLALLDTFAAIPQVKAEVPIDIQVAMWEKFVFISAVSCVGSVTRQPIGGMRSVPETRMLLLSALQETAAVGRARGVSLPEGLAERILLNNIDALDPTTIPSMERDVLDGRPTELESMSGAVLRMGEEAGIPTPTHAFLYAALKPLDIQARR